MMSNTVELTVHEDSFCNKRTVKFSRIEAMCGCYRNHASELVGTLVNGTFEDGSAIVHVTESPDKIRQLCAEKSIPCEDGKRDDA